jgi:hypothetical protein
MAKIRGSNLASAFVRLLTVAIHPPEADVKISSNLATTELYPPDMNRIDILGGRLRFR